MRVRKPLAPCKYCGREMRRATEKLVDFPGTISAGAYGLCQTHYHQYKNGELDSFEAWPLPEPAVDVDWQRDALCAQTDPEVFFPEKGGSTRAAKRVCASCEVREKCLEYALANGENTGIWGGTSPRERMKLRAEA